MRPRRAIYRESVKNTAAIDVAVRMQLAADGRLVDYTRTFGAMTDPAGALRPGRWPIHANFPAQRVEPAPARRTGVAFYLGDDSCRRSPQRHNIRTHQRNRGVDASH